MRTSVIAFVGLLACGAAGYAYVNGLLPAPVSGQVDRALAALGAAGMGGAPQVAPPAQAAVRVPATPVEVAVATSAEAIEEIRSIGSILADEAVVVAPEQAGRIAAIRFSEGEPVKAGDELVKLDDTLLVGELGEAEARAGLAEANYQRASTLSKSGSGTLRALDEAQAERLIANALLRLLRSRLEKTSVRASFDGIVGLRSVSVGAYVEAGDPLTNLDKIDEVKVEFTAPERNLAAIREGFPVAVTVDAFPGEAFAGRIYAIDPQVDINGRSLKVRARLANPDLKLRPGLFARVVVSGASRGAVVRIPEGAVVPRRGDTFVFRVVDGKAVETQVTLGRRGSGLVEIASGVAAGDRVVVAGHARLRDGAAVDVVDTAATS